MTGNITLSASKLHAFIAHNTLSRNVDAYDKGKIVLMKDVEWCWQTWQR